MVKDAQGHALTGATPAAADQIDAATRAFILAYGDAAAHLKAAREAAPECAMAQLAQAWIQALSNDPALVTGAQATIDAAGKLAMGERERVHLAALAKAAGGRWAEAVAILDRHLMAYPFDLLAHQCAMRLDGFQGRFHWEAARAARALPLWSKSQPGFGLMLSFYGFGLEEAGDYARAEDVSREAALLEPHGYWPHHAVSHVLEMTGRPADGLRWMDERRPLWADTKNTNRVHIWWHKSLFHVELGQYAEALALYDQEILPTLRPVGTSLCNGTALLWRLETLGCDGGDRWQKLADLWKGRASGHHSPFNDIHAAMTALRTDDGASFEALLAGIRRSAADGGGMAAAYRDIALPVVEAMQHYRRGAFAACVDRLLPARFDLWRMGGSTAQRDLVDWTLTDAAVRAGNRDVALSLANERIALRPGSTPNRHFLAQADAIAA